MILRYFKQEYQKLILFVFVFILPFAANSFTEDEISEKRNEVAMRMIGHEILMCLGDADSRVMPIEKIDNRYKIPFEREFGFDPGDIISIIDRIVKETEIATFCIVEVEQCDTKVVVHSFVIGNVANSNMITCEGRILPEDCYSLLITISKEIDPIATISENSHNNIGTSSRELSSDGTFFTLSELEESNLLNSTLLIFPLLFLVGFVVYYLKKKNPEKTDPNLIRIGSSRFDKRNMVLYIENKKIELSNKETDLLSLLHTSANKPIEREVILQRVWGDEGDYVGRTLDVFISKLRKKLESDVSVKIVNIRGVGYKLVMDVSG